MRWRSPRVVLVGDIGGASTFHVGDEAMFDADLDLVRRLLPRARCTAVSADPASTASTFGIDAVPRPSADALRATAARGQPAVVAASDADLLVVTGGGNLNSAFPTLIAERLALARATAARGGAIVLLGQTVGPALTPSDAGHVAELLDLACCVGVRDAGSVAITRGLGVDPSKIVEQLDDAWAMTGVPPTGVTIEPDRPAIAVTLHPDPRVVPPRVISVLADQLTQIVGYTGSRVVVIPHCRAAEGPEGRSDEDIAMGLAEQLRTRSVPVTSLPVLTPREVVGATRSAALVISTRYHPLVFAQGGAVPALALWADPYVRAKQIGALAHAGLDAWALPLDEAIGGRLVPAAVEAFERREEIHAWLTSIQPMLEARVATRDAQLAARLREVGLAVRDVDEPATLDAPPHDSAPRPMGGWHDVSAAPAARPVPDPLLAEFVTLRDYARSLEVERDATRSRTSNDGERTPRPASARPVTVLDQLRLEIDAGRAALVGRVSGPGLDDTEIRLRVYAPELATRIDASATPLLPIATIIAATLGTDLVVDAPVDERALENADRATAILEDWWGWRRPTLAAATTIRAVAPGPGVGLWFSRGVDSTYALLRALAGDLVVDGAPVQLTHLLGLDWIDPPFTVLSSAEVWSDTEDAVASVGVPLVRFTTDVRRVLDPIVSWEQSHGAVFVGLGLLVGPALGRVLISGSAEVSPQPFGSHPALDSLWSTSGTTIGHIDDDLGRAENFVRVARDPWAMSRLKVCWKADSARNCGRCSKCLITMTMLQALGALERAERFDSALTVESVRALAASPERLTALPTTVDDILHVLGPEDTELRSAWEAVGDRLRRDAGVPAA